MGNLVEIDNITFRRGERVIYDGVSIVVPKGKITAVMGPSGIGKTTLLKLIGGQLAPEMGDIRFDSDRTETVTFGRSAIDVFAGRTDEPGSARVDAMLFDEAVKVVDALK